MEGTTVTGGGCQLDVFPRVLVLSGRVPKETGREEQPSWTVGRGGELEHSRRVFLTCRRSCTMECCPSSSLLVVVGAARVTRVGWQERGDGCKSRRARDEREGGTRGTARTQQQLNQGNQSLRTTLPREDSTGSPVKGYETRAKARVKLQRKQLRRNRPSQRSSRGSVSQYRSIRMYGN